MDSPSGRPTPALTCDLSIRNPGEDPFSSLYLLAYFLDIDT